MVVQLSVLIRNCGNILAVLFSPTKTLGVECIQFLFPFFDPDGMG